MNLETLLMRKNYHNRNMDKQDIFKWLMITLHKEQFGTNIIYIDKTIHNRRDFKTLTYSS